MAEQGARARAADPVTDEEQARTPDFVARVLEHAGPAAGQGLAPESDEGAAVLDRILAGTPGDQRRPQLREQLEAGTDARAERYWQLLGIINGWPPFQTHVPAFEWMIAALRAHPEPSASADHRRRRPAAGPYRAPAVPTAGRIDQARSKDWVAGLVAPEQLRPMIMAAGAGAVEGLVRLRGEGRGSGWPAWRRAGRRDASGRVRARVDRVSG